MVRKVDKLNKHNSIVLCVCSVVSNPVSPWTVAHQAPLSMEFSK